MTQNYDMNNLTHIIMKTAKAIYDDEKFFVSYLATRADKAAQDHPYDSTMVGLANFLNKRAASKNGLFITRAELKDVYNKLYSPSTKVALYFSKELGLSKQAEQHQMLRNPKEGHSLMQESYAQGDFFLSQQLESIFSGEAPKQYTPEVAQKAKQSVAKSLKSCEIDPIKIEVVAGQPDLLFCNATFETPKGQSHLLVPVEIRNQAALLPNVFLSTKGFVDLNSQFIKDHLNKTAGKSYRVNAQQLLKSLSTDKSEKLRELSEVEKIVLKTASQKGAPANHDPNGILYQEVDPEQYEVEFTPSPDFESFSQKLSSDKGIAEFTHGKEAVEKGRGLVAAELKAAGYSNTQIKVSGANKESINYSVSVGGKFGFNVPVTVADNRITLPRVIIASGKPYSFNSQGINHLLTTADSDPVALANTSQSYGLKPSELVEVVREAMAEDNYLKAEDALQVLSTTSDKTAMQTAYSIYVQALAGQKEEKTTCSAPIKTANSKYLICSHTNLPVHKVYQDKYGNCRPLYRRHMDESYEGGFFSNSKIFG